MTDTPRDEALDEVRFLADNKRWDDALAKLELLRSGGQEDADVLAMLGIAYFNLGREAEGEEAFQRSLAIDSNHPIANFNWAKVLVARGSLESSLIYFHRALPHMPDQTRIGIELAKTYQRLGYVRQLVSLTQRLTKLVPDNPEPWRFLGLAWMGLGRSAEAIAALRRAADLDPDNAAICNDLGLAYLNDGRIADAFHALRRSAHLEPTTTVPVVNLAAGLLETGYRDEAARILVPLLVDHPGDPAARRLWAFHRLLSQVDRDAWLAYESRTQVTGAVANVVVPEIGTTPWKGEDVDGRVLLVVCEQGFGDAFLFARYLADLKRRGATVIVDASVSLQRFFEAQEMVDRVHVREQGIGAYPVHDYWVLIGSLPLHLNRAIGDLSGETGYLHATRELTDHWAEKLKHINQERPRIGVVWAGNARQFRDRFRSLSVTQFAPIFSAINAQFFSLQPGMKQSLIPETCMDLGPALDDFAITAAIVANLDLVITMDSAVANLTAAMGLPVWVLLDVGADWRWGDQPDGTAWYQSARLFRQNKLWDWDGVVARVCVALKEWVERR